MFYSATIGHSFFFLVPGMECTNLALATELNAQPFGTFLGRLPFPVCGLSRPHLHCMQSPGQRYQALLFYWGLAAEARQGSGHRKSHCRQVAWVTALLESLGSSAVLTALQVTLVFPEALYWGGSISSSQVLAHAYNPAFGSPRQEAQKFECTWAA